MTLSSSKNGFLTRLAAAAMVLLAGASASAATVNFSSLETLLHAPTDMMAAKTALWTGWLTQLYENNMPYIELTNGANDPAINQFTMTIGDEDYQFSNEFKNKTWTNSYPFAADGSYALLGFSTPDVELTSSITDGGNQLVIDFGAGGLQPGETVRFQVDINADPDAEGAMIFADYTSVFFTPNDDDGPSSFVTIDFAGTDLDASGSLTNPSIPTEVAQFFQSPRPYRTPQTPPEVPPTTFERVPEPTGVLLASLALVGLAARRRG